MEKTTVFNLIILDESGSMSPLTQATVSGCNETLNVVRAQQEKHADNERHLASIYCFQSGTIPSRYICKNEPIGKVNDITMGDYRPQGCTPLLDAVGMTLIDLEAVASTHEDSVASVTIITDGYENSSTEYTYEMVAKLIDRLKEKGWNINFIGANIDVAKVSKSLHIDNAMSFKSDVEGTNDMYVNLNESLSAYHESRAQMDMAMPNVCREEKIRYRKEQGKNFFRNTKDS